MLGENANVEFGAQRFDHVRLHSELCAARLRLIDAKSEVSTLERRLLSSKARLFNGYQCVHNPEANLKSLQVCHGELEEELNCETIKTDKLAKLHDSCIQDKETAEAASVELRAMLHAASAEAMRASLTISCLQAEVATAEGLARTRAESLAEANAASERLVAQVSVLETEAASEWNVAHRLRQQVREKGGGLAFLRSAARSHVDGLRGSVSVLEHQVKTTTCDVSMAAPAQYTTNRVYHGDSQDAVSHDAQVMSK